QSPCQYNPLAISGPHTGTRAASSLLERRLLRPAVYRRTHNLIVHREMVSLGSKICTFSIRLIAREGCPETIGTGFCCPNVPSMIPKPSHAIGRRRMND